MEAETFYLFYEGANPESKDLMNSSSGRNFTKNKASEAREILGRLIDAKKTYDHPRIIRRGSANAIKEQEGEGVGDKIDRLEKALLSAIEKKSSPTSQEKEKPPGPEENQLQLYYGPPPDGEFQAQVNAVENWNQTNQNTSWNQWKIKEAPWRDNPCFRWADGNQQLQLQYPGPAETRRTGLAVVRMYPSIIRTGQGKTRKDQTTGVIATKGTSPTGTTGTRVIKGTLMCHHIKGTPPKATRISSMHTKGIKGQGISSTTIKEVRVIIAQIRGADRATIR